MSSAPSGRALSTISAILSNLAVFVAPRFETLKKQRVRRTPCSITARSIIPQSMWVTRRAESDDPDDYKHGNYEHVKEDGPPNRSPPRTPYSLVWAYLPTATSSRPSLSPRRGRRRSPRDRPCAGGVPWQRLRHRLCRRRPR